MSRARKSSRFFVSHISEEAELAKLLRTELEEDFVGHVSFFTSSDVGSISAGSEWLDVIQESLAGAAAVLVLCSPLSITRPWVQFELGAAWMKRRRIIPICHSGMKLTDLPMPLSQLQGIQLDSEIGIRRLYQAIAEVLKWPKVPQAGNLQRFLGHAAEISHRLQHSVQQFERYIDIVVPAPGLVDATGIPPNTKIESDDDSLELFGLRTTATRTWADICRAASRTPDTRWLRQLAQCVHLASHNMLFRPVQAIYHGERGSYQPQLARKQTMPDGSCRYHVHLVETTVAPLTEVQNDFGLLATLMRLGLRFRYEVIEHFERGVRTARLKPQDKQSAEIQQLLCMLRNSIQVIENDVMSRGAENFSRNTIAALFDEAEGREMIRMQCIWDETRALLFRKEPVPSAEEIVEAMRRLREMNYLFTCHATKRYHDMVRTRWGGDTNVSERRGSMPTARAMEAPSPSFFAGADG